MRINVTHEDTEELRIGHILKIALGCCLEAIEPRRILGAMAKVFEQVAPNLDLIPKLFELLFQTGSAITGTGRILSFSGCLDFAEGEPVTFRIVLNAYQIERRRWLAASLSVSRPSSCTKKVDGEA